MERVIRDANFAVRLLWRDRTFALTALLTLAVCIGANAAIFAIINSVLLRPLPVPEPEQLVRIFNSYPRAGVERASNGVPDYYDRLREVDVFSEQALYNTRGLTISATSAGGGDPQRMTGLVARPSLLRMLRVQPFRGRIFTEEEGEQGRDRQVMLTYGLWQQLFAASESTVGSTMRINSEPYTIIGILPADFTFVDPEIKLWVPLSFTAEERSDDSRHSNNWSMIGRLKPGASVAQAQQQLDALNARNMERFPAFREILTNAGFHTTATPFQADLVREIRGTLFLLWAGVLLRSADWRGEYHQPRARAIERAHEGDGDAAGTRRRTVDSRPADPDGDAAADGPRRHRRSRAGTLGPDDADRAGDVGAATGQRDPDGLHRRLSSRSRWRSSSASSSGWRPSSTCATST